MNSSIFPIGTSVRISKECLPFHKAYIPTWSEEIFKIKSVLKNRRPIVYQLQSATGPIKGIFYQQEIQPVKDTGIFRISKIVGRRKKNGQTQLCVQWQGYKESSWINESDLVEVPIEALIDPVDQVEGPVDPVDPTDSVDLAEASIGQEDKQYSEEF